MTIPLGLYLLAALCILVNMTTTRGGVQKVPGKTELQRYLSKGLTQTKIVEAWLEDSGVRVSRSAIAMAIERYGLASSHPRQRYEDMLPWHVITEHRMKFDARMLRAEARRRRGLAVSDKEKKLLTSWRVQLDDAGAVVTYDPRTEEGFFWTPRLESDTDIIRRPK